MHVNWEVSVWNIASWLISGLAAAFAAGKASQLLTILVGKVTKLETGFEEHEKSDIEHFENIAQSQADLRVEVAKLQRSQPVKP
jgi:hypothetical protein